MKVYLSEIKDTDSEIEVTEADAWVNLTLEQVDEELQELRKLQKNPPKRHTHVHFNLRKVDDVFVISGEIQAEVHLLCSRCADSFALKVDDHFSSLYTRDKEMAGISFLDKNSSPKGQNKGYARHNHNDEEQYEDQKESGHDVEIAYIQEEYIDLSDVLLEQLQLKIPFRPLCKEDCKGICSTCGADQNKGRCACSKIKTANAFSALQGLKIKTKH